MTTPRGPMAPGSPDRLTRAVMMRLRGPYNRFRHVGITEDDVLLASYPKSGNTWLKFLFSSLFLTKDVDFQSVENVIPYVGAHRKAPRILPHGGRLIKTHEAFAPQYQKAIYVIRDGRDVAVSYYHHLLRLGRGTEDKPTFVRRFVDAELNHYGAWDKHVLGWLGGLDATRSIHVVRYEDLRRDPHGELRKVCRSIGADKGDDQIAAAVEAASMSQMRKKELAAGLPQASVRNDITFVRKGMVGEWVGFFDEQEKALLTARFEWALRACGYSLDEDAAMRADVAPRAVLRALAEGEVT